MGEWSASSAARTVEDVGQRLVAQVVGEGEAAAEEPVLQHGNAGTRPWDAEDGEDVAVLGGHVVPLAGEPAVGNELALRRVHIRIIVLGGTQRSGIACLGPTGGRENGCAEKDALQPAHLRNSETAPRTRSNEPLRQNLD